MSKNRYEAYVANLLERPRTASHKPGTALPAARPPVTHPPHRASPVIREAVKTEYRRLTAPLNAYPLEEIKVKKEPTPALPPSPLPRRASPDTRETVKLKHPAPTLRLNPYPSEERERVSSATREAVKMEYPTPTVPLDAPEERKVKEEPRWTAKMEYPTPTVHLDPYAVEKKKVQKERTPKMEPPSVHASDLRTTAEDIGERVPDFPTASGSRAAERKGAEKRELSGEREVHKRQRLDEAGMWAEAQTTVSQPGSSVHTDDTQATVTPHPTAMTSRAERKQRRRMRNQAAFQTRELKRRRADEAQAATAHPGPRCALENIGEGVYPPTPHPVTLTEAEKAQCRRMEMQARFEQRERKRQARENPVEDQAPRASLTAAQRTEKKRRRQVKRQAESEERRQRRLNEPGVLGYVTQAR
ncbi:hypothetical protein DFH06DRAFT_1300772 [Mycena polygramma]|nr:hypothetical protein DFH06DRAFT_1300772 [Mycena polygramma]